MARLPITIKEAKLIKGIAEGKTPRESALATYNVSTPESASAMASKTLAKVNVRAALDAELAKQGITLEKIIQPVAAALDAKIRIKSVVTGETVEIDAPDLEMNLKGHDRAVKLMGLHNTGDGGNTINNYGTIVAAQREKYGI
jgi:hypothetical protein